VVPTNGSTSLSGVSSVITASFASPAGSVLVAIAITSSNNTINGVTDSSGGGYAWTKVVSQASSTWGNTTIWLGTPVISVADAAGAADSFTAAQGSSSPGAFAASADYLSVVPSYPAPSAPVAMIAIRQLSQQSAAGFLPQVRPRQVFTASAGRAEPGGVRERGAGPVRGLGPARAAADGPRDSGIRRRDVEQLTLAR
jgi:hypothetical protein